MVPEISRHLLAYSELPGYRLALCRHVLVVISSLEADGKCKCFSQDFIAVITHRLKENWSLLYISGGNYVKPSGGHHAVLLIGLHIHKYLINVHIWQVKFLSSKLYKYLLNHTCITISVFGSGISSGEVETLSWGSVYVFFMLAHAAVSWVFNFHKSSSRPTQWISALQKFTFNIHVLTYHLSLNLYKPIIIYQATCLAITGKIPLWSATTYQKYQSRKNIKYITIAIKHSLLLRAQGSSKF